MMYKSFVTEDVANARANHCKKCPFNIFPDKGPFIKFSDAMANAMVGKKRVEAYDDLGNCAVCSCPLRGKVWYNGEVDLTDEQEKSMKSVDCWQLSLPRSKD